MPASPSPLRLSVALVTRNRPESLRRCLASLRAQDCQPFEVMVADDSDPPQAAVTQRVAEEFGGQYVTGPRRGLYANRNHAFRACQGTHVRTMDDDHTFPAGHFARCWAAVCSDPRAIWTTGETSFLDGQHHATAPTANQLHPSGAGCAVNDPDNNWAIADGSTIYPRDVFDRHLWLVEDWPYGSAYLEFGALLHHCGWRSRCVQGALVEHHAEAATLHRARDRRLIPSQLFASLCFNLCFRPNVVRAVRHALGCLKRDPLNPALWRGVPALMARARARWRAATQSCSRASTPAKPPVASGVPCLAVPSWGEGK